MAEELKVGCARPTGGPVSETAPEQTPVIEKCSKKPDTIFVKGLNR